ncbi:MAG: MmcQ/YjbR family DNA-binding protein [Bacteroidales bacterium]|nr:MmcQ/YjbR family DNA-binding protein [Bacteroidales bacterium]
MNIEEIREYCLSKNGATESFPFDEVTLVFKVKNKMFALMSLEGDLSINLKNSPEIIIELREEYSSVVPGYHMNKNHWNTVYVDGTIKPELIYRWIDKSYDIIVSKLPRKTKNELLNI